MASPKEPDGGCLSVLSSCFKNRGKTHSEALSTPRQAVSAAKTSEALAPSQVTAQGHASIPRTAGDPASQPVEACKRPSASHGDEPGSTVPTSDQISAPVKPPETTTDLWQEAYNEVDENTRKWIDANIRQWTENTTTDTNVGDLFPELVSLVRNSEEKHDQETWQIKVGGRVVLLRDYTSRVNSWLVTIGGIAINFAPAPSPVIWSAVKVLLAANVSQCEDLVSIMGCTDMVLCLVRRGTVYEEVYLSDLPYSSAQGDLKQTLVSVYKTCLEFLAFVDKELRQGSLRRFLDALLDPGHGEQRVLDVKALEQGLESAARACEAVASLTRDEEHRKLLQSLQGPLKRIDDRVAAVLATCEKAERAKIMDYISTIQVGIHHNEKCESRTKGTCGWLVSHPKFREWEDLSCSSVFWLQGNIGTGKSYLSSKVIDRYRAHKEDSDEGFGFFYCHRSDSSRKNIRSILRSYIRQLSEIPRRAESIHKALIKLYDDGKNIQNDLTLVKCKSTLVEIINSYPRTTLVLDALDECDEETRRELAELFQNLVVNIKGLLKVFIASRKESDIEKYLRSFRSRQMLVSITTSDNTGDIEKFVIDEMAKLGVSWASITDDTKLLVKNTLVEMSDGMFRWTYLQWQQLKQCRMNIEVRQRLQKLPETLSASYDEIYDRYGPNDFQRVMLQRAVRWVLCAHTPLDSVILLSAMRFESGKMDGQEAFDKSDLTELTLETVCQHLVIRDSQLGIWKFPHASVAEHFAGKNEPWIQNAKSEITIFLINCLIDCCAAFSSVWPPPEVRDRWERTASSSPLSISPPESRDSWESSRSLKDDVDDWFKSEGVDPYEVLDPRHPLQTYTQQEWLKHIKDSSDQDPKFADVSRALKRFLGEKGPRQSSNEYRVFCKYIMAGRTNQYGSMRYYVEPSENSTFGIIAMGLSPLLVGWWDHDLDPSQINAVGQDLLAVAAMSPHKNVCEDLVGRDFNINRDVDDWYQSALGLAIGSRNIDIMRLLLRNGANPDLATRGRSLLCLAAMSRMECVQIMLDAEADPNIQCGSECRWGCALSMASHSGDIAIVKALIKADAEVNPKFVNSCFLSPLAEAVQNGRFDCARLLLEHGADVNAPLEGNDGCQRCGSILEAAVEARKLNLTRLLVEHGADVKTPLKNQRYDTILGYAVEKGDVDFARFLIERGADVHSHMKAREYGSILATAILAPQPSLAMVKFLIEEAGADLEQLLRKPQPEVRDRTSSRESLSSSYMSYLSIISSETDASKTAGDRSRAEIAAYLMNEQQVEAQVLIDINLLQ